MIRGTRESFNELNVALHVTSVESSIEIMCERSEDVTKLPEIVNFNIFLPVNMSIALLYLSVENQKGGCIKPN